MCKSVTRFAIKWFLKIRFLILKMCLNAMNKHHKNPLKYDDPF